MRKLKELKYAITLEKKLTKDQILEGYLNLAYYGDRAYGVEAAAQHYFSVHADKLSLLAGRAARRADAEPRHDRPGELPEEGRGPPQRRARPHARARPDHRQAVAGREEAHPQAGHARAAARRARASRRPTPTGATSSSTTPWRCPQLGKTVEERKRILYRGGVTIRRPSTRGCSRSRSRRSPRRCRSATSPASAPRPTSRTRHRQGARLRAEHDLHRGQGDAGKTGINWALDKQLGRFRRFPVRLDGQGVRPRDGHGVRDDAARERQRQGGRRQVTWRPTSRRTSPAAADRAARGTSTTTRSSGRQHQPHEGDRAVDQHRLRRPRRAARRLQGARHHAPPRPAPRPTGSRSASTPRSTSSAPPSVSPAGRGAGLRRPRRRRQEVPDGRDHEDHAGQRARPAEDEVHPGRRPRRRARRPTSSSSTT